ncbi:MAG: RNA polymerase factor sigma-54 [Lachnospiraceae bacterium]|nr:RNA polymerase factor sigma-54 [Lachnospiraceae bacterium]
MELILTTSQKLTLSQRMVQSTEILQMSTQELLDYIKELAVENPVVECVEKEEEAEKERFDIIRKKLDWLNSMDEQNKFYYNEDKEEEETTSDFWVYKEGEMGDLNEYLLSQLNVVKKDEESLKLGRFIIYCLEPTGYLKESVKGIAKITGASIAAVKEMLEIIQGFEPAGVAASTLKECLMIQIKRKGIKNPLVERIINEELETLGKNHIHIIAKRLKASKQEVVEACNIIKGLNPKPGNSFSADNDCQYIIPDIIIENSKDGYKIVVNDNFLPVITIGRYYRDVLKDGDAAAKEYVGEKIRQAEWAIKCIARRGTTLLKTVEAMINMQTDFLDKGPGNLSPMRLSDIAEVIGMHESTVSRAVRDKYLQCSWGVFPLSFFFSKAMATDDDETVSQEKIKMMIRNIIAGEDKASPLSDREITERLNEEGIKISRRTVAKYREAIGIPGASSRKNY